MVYEARRMVNEATVAEVDKFPGIYSRIRDRLVEQFANMSELEKFKSVTEQRNKFLKDFRQYEPLTDFSPRATIPKPFLLRTEVRAKLWNLQSRNQCHTPTKKHFRARPMPNFETTGLFFTKSTSKEKSMSAPEAFDFGTDNVVPMRSSMCTRDDIEVGRYRFKPLELPDFTFIPSDSMYEVNMIMPFLPYVRNDEKNAGRIRFDGTSRPKEVNQAVSLPQITRKKVANSLHSRSTSASKGRSQRDNTLTREGKPPTDRLSRRTHKERKTPISRTIAKESAISRRQERNRSQSPALLQIRTRSKSITPVKKRNVGPPMNYITRSMSRTPTGRHKEQDVQSDKFRAKLMPDFSRPFRVSSSRRHQRSHHGCTVGQKSSQTFNSMEKPPINNGLSSSSRSIRNTTPSKPHSTNLGMHNNRKIPTSPKPFNLSTRRRPRLPITEAPKIFKARPMPGFYTNATRCKLHNSAQCQPEEDILCVNPRIFKARPMPAFYINPACTKKKNEEATRKNCDGKSSIKSRTSKARPIPACSNNSSSLCKNKDREDGKDNYGSVVLRMGSSPGIQYSSVHTSGFDPKYFDGIGRGAEKSGAEIKYDNTTDEHKQKKEKLPVINEDEITCVEDNETCRTARPESTSSIVLEVVSAETETRVKYEAEIETRSKFEASPNCESGTCININDDGPGRGLEEILKKRSQEFAQFSYDNLNSTMVPMEEMLVINVEDQGSHPFPDRVLTKNEGESKENAPLNDADETSSPADSYQNLHMDFANPEAELREKYGVLLNRWRMEREKKYGDWLTKWRHESGMSRNCSGMSESERRAQSVERLAQFLHAYTTSKGSHVHKMQRSYPLPINEEWDESHTTDDDNLQTLEKQHLLDVFVDLSQQVFCGHDSDACDTSCFRGGSSPESRRICLAEIPFE